MAKILTTSELIETALRRAMIPSDQSTFDDEDIIDIMNEEIGIHILPVVLRAHEEYYVVNEDIPLVDGQTKYKIPYRAVGNKLRDIHMVDGANALYEMTRISSEHRSDYHNRFYGRQYNKNIPFYLENDSIVLLTETPSAASIRMTYYLRPNDMVLEKRGATITDITVDTDTTTLTLTQVPDHFPATVLYDFVQAQSPNKILGFDIAMDSVNPTLKTITFKNDDISSLGLKIGDHLAKAEETFVAQIPTELQPILAQRVAVKMLEALGDAQGMQMAQNELERMEYNSQTLIDNRVEGAPQKISNRHSMLRTTIGPGRIKRL